MNEAVLKNQWFDGRITLALLFSFLMQAIAAFLWIGSTAQRLDGIEIRLNQQAPIAERMARLEAEMAGARASLNRIENRLDNGGAR